MQLVNRFSIALALAAAVAYCSAAQQQSPSQPATLAPQAGQRNSAGDRLIGPPTQIVSFTAEPASIQPGATVTMKWQVVNALERIFIEPDVGVVETQGSVTLTPSRTTVYTLTAEGRAGSIRQSVTVKVAGTNPAAETPVSDPLANLPITHLSDGKPDLSGVYIADFGGRPTSPKLVPGAEKYKVGIDYGAELGEHCLPPGVPGATQQPYPLQIVEAPNQVLILYEAYHLFRVIPTDGRPHPANLDPTWLGNSAGHWEGDTLVVDVTGFNDKTAVGEYRHTTAYHIVERYTRTVYDKIHYEATIEDPNVFAAPWNVDLTLRLHPEWQIQEYICEENNHDYGKLFERYGGSKEAASGAR